MINRLFTLLLLITCFIGSHTVTAQTAAYTIIANPGENASNEIRLNWHTDLNVGNSLITYTKVSDKNWKKAITVSAQQEICTVFDSIYSKRSNGDDFYENARFIRNTVALLDLEQNTTYKFKISAQKSDLHDDSEVRYFKTAPKSNKWTMGVISDMHVYAPLAGRQQSAMKMIQQLERQHKKPLDMMLHVGDISAWGGSYSFWPVLYADTTFKKYVWAGVNGNHDDMTRKHDKNIQFFRNVNNNPLNGYANEVGVCYHFKYGNTLFVMLNSESMRSEEELTQAQQWAAQVIRTNPAQYIVVVTHYQWFMGGDGRSSQYSRWKAFFDEHNVDLALSGNNHIYVRTNALYADKETDGLSGTVYVQTPSSDNERGQPMGELLNNHDLIEARWTEGNNTVGALLMNASKKHLTLRLYDRNGKQIDEVKVKSKR